MRLLPPRLRPNEKSHDEILADLKELKAELAV